MINEIESLVLSWNGGIQTNSRLVSRGDMFLAFPSSTIIENINYAVLNGASVVICNDDCRHQSHIVVRVNNVYEILPLLVKRVNHLLPRNIVGITGTNGKSSTVMYYRQIIELLGYRSVAIGTLGVKSNVEELTLKYKNFDGLTTNNLIDTLNILLDAKKYSAEFAALEVSSHALDQKRIYGLKFDVAALLNISHDHLDYHQTYENYRDAKFLLFDSYVKDKGMIMIPKQYKNYKLYPYESIYLFQDIDFEILERSIDNMLIEVRYKGRNYKFCTKIFGRFQIQNLLTAALCVERCGFLFEEIIKNIHLVKSIPGRMEMIKYRDSYIFVDYAHNHDAMKNILLEIQVAKMRTCKVITLFGCGGERDKSKRYLMGRVAGDFSDIVVVTDDNPRNENASSIRATILDGCKSTNNSNVEILEIGDRKKAIEFAIKEIIAKSQENFILIIFGKGHEKFQIIGNNRLPHNDMGLVAQLI